MTETICEESEATKSEADATAAYFYNLGNKQLHARKMYEKRAYFSDRRQYDKWILMSRRNKDKKCSNKVFLLSLSLPCLMMAFIMAF